MSFLKKYIISLWRVWNEHAAVFAHYNTPEPSFVQWNLLWPCVFPHVDDRNGFGCAVIVVRPPPVPAARQGSGPQPPHGGPGVWGRHPAPPARRHGAAGHRPAQGGVSRTPGHQHCRASEHTGYVGCICHCNEVSRILSDEPRDIEIVNVTPWFRYISYQCF